MAIDPMLNNLWKLPLDSCEKSASLNLRTLCRTICRLGEANIFPKAC
jgi:hypothetical protein